MTAAPADSNVTISVNVTVARALLESLQRHMQLRMAMADFEFASLTPSDEFAQAVLVAHAANRKP